MALKHFLIVSLCTLFLIACGDSSTDEANTHESPPAVISTLPTVDDYLLENTPELIATVSGQLQGLTIDDFFEQAFLLTSNRNTEAMISDGFFNGLDSATVQLNNIADNYAMQSSAIYTAILEQLQTYNRDTLTKSQQISYDVYEADLQAKIEWIAYIDYEYPATYGFFGWPGSTETFFTQAFTFSDKPQAEIYLALLNQVGRRFSQIGELLEARKAQGIIEPAVTLGYSQDLVAAMANSAATSTSYYQAFTQQLSTLSNITEADKTVLTATLLKTIEERILPAYNALAEKMAVLVNEAPKNIGFGQFEGGKDFYDFTLRFFTSSHLSSDQIHDLGIEELARIHSEMRTLFDQLGYPQNENLSSLYTRVDIDAGIIPANKTKSTYENLIAQAYTELPSLFEVLPQQEVIVVGGNSGGYYIAGSDDGSRPGAFYANTTADSPYTTMPTLAYHEAVPGHHLQIALANELDLPLFRKKSHFTSFIEGWGLYAERLAKDAGWYEQDVYGDLGRLQFEAMRAARLVVDTGIHNKGWSYDEANQFHSENVGFSGSIARYSVWPGQATAYMTGMLKILALRQQAKNQLAERYDIKEFHSAIIGNGSMPLNVLQTVVDNYIAEKLIQ
jgi:uncharacterized protein (DUF885 family)